MKRVKESSPLTRPPETFGEYLRRERELRQIPLEDVASGTKIGLYMLRAIEENRWEALPAEVFVRGFIRNYAEFIGLVPDEVIFRYESERGRRLSPEEETIHSVGEDKGGSREKKRAATILLVFLLLAVAFLLCYQFFLRPSRNISPAPEGSAESFTAGERAASSPLPAAPGGPGPAMLEGAGKASPPRLPAGDAGPPGAQSPGSPPDKDSAPGSQH